MPYTINDGLAWETGHGVWMLINGTWTLVRNMRESSTGSVLNLSGSATILIDVGGVDLQQLATPPLIQLTANTTLVPGQSYEGRASALALILPLSTGPTGLPISFVGTFGDEVTNPVTIALTGSDTITAGSPPQTDTSATYKQTNLPLVFYQRAGGWNAF